MTASFKKMLDAHYEGATVEEILRTSPAALQGVSESDAEKLREAFGIKTVRELAENKFFRYAQALLAAGGWPNYDPGPPPAWQEFFAAAPKSFFINHSSRRFRKEFGGVFYRGRLDGTARVLIVGQDPATDELIAHRAFVGRSGQRLQGLLKKIGITRSYIMVNTFLYSVFGQFNTELKNISLEAPILDYRNELLNKLCRENELEAVLAIGAGARHAVDVWGGYGQLPVFELTHPAAPENLVMPNWNQHLPQLRSAIRADDEAPVDTVPYGTAFTPTDEIAIPRFDLPFGVPAWHGTGGGRSRRDGNSKIIWNAPEANPD